MYVTICLLLPIGVELAMDVKLTDFFFSLASNSLRSDGFSNDGLSFSKLIAETI